MNLQGKLLFLSISSLLLLTAILGRGWVSPSTKSESVLGERETNSPQRELEYHEISPDGSKLVILYKIPFHPGIYANYHDYLANQNFIAVKETESENERYIFVTDHRSGYPHWLDNNYIYFTIYCGTACKGIQLVGAGGTSSKLAVLSYIYNNEAKKYETHFKDWFERVFVFEGLVGDVKSETTNNKSYLIFKMKDDNGNFLYNKRFLFTGQNLSIEK